MAKAKRRLILFARFPVAGKAKTRLIPALGADGAAALHRRLVLRTLRTAHAFCLAHNVQLEICFAGDDERKMRHWLGESWPCRPQAEGDLGQRMAAAFAASFDEGSSATVIIGSDCPGLTVETLAAAFESLKTHPAVLGPATDGGYYLVGLTRLVPELFQDVPWGTDAVLGRSLEILKRENVAHSLLEPLDDLDRPEDLPAWQQRIADEESDLSRVSVIIPARNEAANLPATIASVRQGILAAPQRAAGVSPEDHSFHESLDSPPGLGVRQSSGAFLLPQSGRRLSRPRQPLSVQRPDAHPYWEGDAALEIIVVDGGSTDDTVAVAKDLGVTVIESSPGRARQMNAGAALATGNTLLFLHADTHMPAGWLEPVAHALAAPGVVAGAFGFQINGRFRGRRLTEVTTNWRSRWLQNPYGDQALFLRRFLFEEIGGYADLPIMEDFELVRRLRQLGRIVTLREKAITSGRRWEKVGVLRTTLTNHAVVTGYHLGVNPTRLRRLYEWLVR